MSKVKITGNASGTGTLTISAPNTNTDRTLTLPDGAGEILTDAGLKTINGSSVVGSGDLEVGGGKVLQVVQSIQTSSFTTTNTSWADTGHSITITPTASDSKILIMHTAGLGNSTTQYGQVNIFRGGSGGTSIGDSTHGTAYFYDSASTPHYHTASGQFLDSPATTSATTYNVYARAYGSGTCIYMPVGNKAWLIAMEIGA